MATLSTDCYRFNNLSYQCFTCITNAEDSIRVFGPSEQPEVSDKVKR